MLPADDVGRDEVADVCAAIECCGARVVTLYWRRLSRFAISVGGAATRGSDIRARASRGIARLGHVVARQPYARQMYKGEGSNTDNSLRSSWLERGFTTKRRPRQRICDPERVSSDEPETLFGRLRDAARYKGSAAC